MRPNKKRNAFARPSASAHAATLKKYGMTVRDYNAVFARQGGICPICLKRSEQILCVDHDHNTRQRRALLCRNCNVGLGCFNDDPATMRRAADYLERWARQPGPLLPTRGRLPARSTRRPDAAHGSERHFRSQRRKGRAGSRGSR